MCFGDAIDGKLGAMLSYSFFCLLKLNALWIFFGAIAMGNTRRGLSGAVTPAYDICFSLFSKQSKLIQIRFLANGSLLFSIGDLKVSLFMLCLSPNSTYFRSRTCIRKSDSLVKCHAASNKRL